MILLELYDVQSLLSLYLITCNKQALAPPTIKFKNSTNSDYSLLTFTGR